MSAFSFVLKAFNLYVIITVIKRSDGMTEHVDVLTPLLAELLIEYKRMNGIDLADNSQNDTLVLYLEVALEIAKRKSCKWDKWDNFDDIPKPIILGIMMLVGLIQTRNDLQTSGIKSESIGGMSQTFMDIDKMNDDDFFKSAYDLFDMYCGQKERDKQFVFKKAKRGSCNGRY